MMEFEWIPFTRDLLVRAACNRFKNLGLAALYLGMSERALFVCRKRLGIVGQPRPEPPEKEQWYKLLDLVPRTVVESYLLETFTDDRS